MALKEVPTPPLHNVQDGTPPPLYNRQLEDPLLRSHKARQLFALADLCNIVIKVEAHKARPASHSATNANSSITSGSTTSNPQGVFVWG